MNDLKSWMYTKTSKIETINEQNKYVMKDNKKSMKGRY